MVRQGGNILIVVNKTVTHSKNDLVGVLFFKGFGFFRVKSLLKFGCRKYFNEVRVYGSDYMFFLIGFVTCLPDKSF